MTVEHLAELAEQRHRDPTAVWHRACDLLAETSTPDVEAPLRWVLGLAFHELGRVAEAIESYRLAVEISAAHRFRDVEAQARAGLAISLVSAGQAEEAAEQIDQARAVATETTRGVVEMLYGLVQQRTGQLAQAQATYGRALRRLQARGETTSIARLRLNRGILRAYRGDSRGAVSDLVAAEQIASDQQLLVLSAMAAHNLGFAHGRRGDLPQALSAFGRAEEAYAAAGAPESLAAVLEADRCEVLLVAGLVSEAQAAAQAAVCIVAGTGDLAYLAECRLLLARTLLAAGQYGDARDLASAVGEEFRAARRRPWAALAKYVAIQAEILQLEDGVPPSTGLITRAQRVATALEHQGWTVEAAHVRIFAGQLALASGRAAMARANLAKATASRHRGTADMRAQSWYASALLRVATGDRRGARQALSRGLRVVDEHLSILGATELRAHAAGYGTDLARLGVRLAIEQRRPAELLRWAERWRASSLRHPPVRPPDDDQLAGELTELRRVRSELRRVALAGGPTGRLERTAISIEATVRRRLLAAPGSAVTRGRLDVAELRRSLGRRELVEYADQDGRLYAVTVAQSRSRLVELGSLGAIQQELTHLLFALRRSLRMAPIGPMDPLVWAAAERVDRLLVAPLRLHGTAPLVVVPTATLHGLPWGRLPSLVERDVTVAPSADVWARDHGGTTTRQVERRVLLVAGPGLPGGSREVRRLATLYPGAQVLTGRQATASAVLDGLGRAGLVHLAAHGTFRSDSPLFSSFLLADGPLTVHDLERAPIAAATVVLAACHAGVTGVIGDELIGTSATLLALGVRSIVAPVLAIPDTPTASFMVELHRRLRAGDTASAALAATKFGRNANVASVFLCLGRNEEAGQQ